MIELLLAMALSLLVCLGMAALAHPAGHLSAAQPEAVDMQQRVRTAAAALTRDLHAAGAGLDSGPASGPLVGYLPPVIPRRIGASGGHAAGVARSDVLTLLWVPETQSQTTLAAPTSGGTAEPMSLPGCPVGRTACGFSSGMTSIVFDTSGAFDLFNITSVVGSLVSLRRLNPSSSHMYAAGARMSEVVTRTYYLDSSSRQLRQYDGDASDIPAIDDVTTMRVEYFGMTTPPRLPRPASGIGNCLYDAAGNALPGLRVLPASVDGYAALPLEMFTDGPWCGSGATAFDADLLRVRRVRLTIGVRASSALLRATGHDFSMGGLARSAWRRLPDIVVSFDVAPRNLRAVEAW